MKELTREEKVFLLEQLKEEVKRPTGRPRAEITKDAQLGIRLESCLKDDLQKKAKRESRTLSAVCEHLIKRGLQKEGNRKVKRLPQDDDQKTVQLPVINLIIGQEEVINLKFDKEYQVFEIAELIEGLDGLLIHQNKPYFTALGNWEG